MNHQYGDGDEILMQGGRTFIMINGPEQSNINIRGCLSNGVLLLYGNARPLAAVKTKELIDK